MSETVSPNIEKVEEFEFTLPLMTLGRARDMHMLNGFLGEFYEGKWPQGRQLRRPVTELDLEYARRIARLDEVDELMRHGSEIFLGEERKLYKQPTTDQRIFVWVRDGGKCHYCTYNSHPDYGGFKPDHRKPFSHGGSTTLDNLVCACTQCNIAKGQNDAEAFMRLMQHPQRWRYRNALFRDHSGQKFKKEDIKEANEIMYG